MRSLRFKILLAGVIASLALLAVLGMSSVAYGLLRRLARQDAIERATLASAAGAQAVQRLTSELAASADRLRDAVPGLGPAALAARLQESLARDGLAACGLVLPAGTPLVVRREAGAVIAWPAATPPGAAWQRGARGEVLLLSSAALAAPAGGIAWVARELPVTLLADASPYPSTTLALLVHGAEPPEGEARARLRETAFTLATAQAGELAADRLFVAVRPLPPPLGQLAVEATVPSAATEVALVGFRQRLLWLAVVVAGGAALCGLLLGQWLAAPIGRLEAAAARLGAGDLETPVGRPAGAELSKLAEALDDMRARLRRQTADLRRQQAETSAILGGIAEGVFTVDRDRRLRYLNPQVAAMLGISAPAALGAFCGDVLRPAPQGGLRPCEEHCPIVHARSRGTATAIEHLTLADGSRRTVVITSSPPAEELQFQVLRDETEGEAARRLRDAVLANISHEFKTPLSAQLASIELLADRVTQQGDGPSEHLVRSLERGTLRLTQLVDNLLESARIEAGSHSIRRRRLQLDEVVEEAVQLTAPLFHQREQQIDVRLPYPLPAVLGDAPRLVQVFVNLLANANKFAPAGSRIVLGGDVAADSVAAWVEDQGPGLPEGAGRSLFGRFVRSAGDDEPEQSGMGLGLWIAQSIVERHGGSIDSERLDDRTRVAVRLPRAPQEGAEG